jgi:Terminase RNaseH-like domain
VSTRQFKSDAWKSVEAAERYHSATVAAPAFSILAAAAVSSRSHSMTWAIKLWRATSARRCWTFQSARPGSSVATGDGISSTSGGNESTIPSSRPLCAYWPRHVTQRVLVEDAGAGTSLVQELLGEVDGILAIKPDRVKISRLAIVSSKFESGLVFFPERAPWLADFEAELFAFLGSRHDDQCDSVSQALTDDNCGFPMMISAEAIAAARIRRPWMRRYG